MPELQQNMIDDLSSVTTESWRTFRIMAEMVEALDALNALKVKCISLFGTARCKPDSTTKHTDCKPKPPSLENASEQQILPKAQLLLWKNVNPLLQGNNGSRNYQ